MTHDVRPFIDPVLAEGTADRVAFLECVCRDDPDHVRADAATLRAWLQP